MLNTHASTPPDPFRALVPSPKYVDPLGLMPPAAVPLAQPEPLTVQAAVVRLVAAGLFCQGVSTPRLHILGGTAEFVEHGIPGYEGPFGILAEPEGAITAMVAGLRGAPDEEVHVDSLADAVAFVLRVYRARGVLAAPEAQR
jgi:hypothetical protein